MPFDPCNGVPASARYLTVATGRDYGDVPPTSGTYIGPAGAQLTSNRRVAVSSTLPEQTTSPPLACPPRDRLLAC
jgi:transglutaminase-like putative cysteine protease